MKKTITLFALLTLISSFVSAGTQNYIQNDVFWMTTAGKPIYSQGGGIFRFKDPATGLEHYYWYGVHYSGAESYLASPTGKTDNTGFVSVTCYMSDDLMNWTFVRDVLTYAEVNSHQWPYWVGRLGVAYVPDAKQYALLVQFNSSVLIATCNTPTGNYKWHNNIDMTSIIGTSNTGDQTVFTDDNGKSYLVYSYGSGRSKIYLSEIGFKNGKVTLLDCVQVYKGSGREGNCMFKYKNKYYICASDLYGWNSSNVYYLESESIYGPYLPTNNMSKMNGASNDFGHVTQTGFFYTVKGTAEETVIYCGDRWSDFAGNGNGYNQWCPIDFDNNTPYFNSLSQWSINSVTGEWTVGENNNYAKNGSFEADRVNIPSGNKPVQDYLRGWTTVVSKGNKVAVGGADSPVLNASNSSTDRATVIGNHCLNITDKTDFSRHIYQTIQSTSRVTILDGIYRMTAKAKLGTGFEKMQMYAKNNDTMFTADITDTDGKWHQVSIDSIAVRGGKITIGFLADGKANSWCHVDDVELVRVKDLPVETSIQFPAYESSCRTTYYSLDGSQLSAPRKGINVVKKQQGSKREAWLMMVP